MEKDAFRFLIIFLSFFFFFVLVIPVSSSCFFNSVFLFYIISLSLPFPSHLFPNFLLHFRKKKIISEAYMAYFFLHLFIFRIPIPNNLLFTFFLLLSSLYPFYNIFPCFYAFCFFNFILSCSLSC